MSTVLTLIRRLLVEDDAQDLIEYALLTGGIALATAAGMQAITNAVGTVYPVRDTAQQNIWESPDPGAGS